MIFSKPVTYAIRALIYLAEHKDEGHLLNATIAEVEDIRWEKGFRFGPSLLTSREHKEIGSTGYGGIYWDTDPDIPIPILKARLLASGQLDANTTQHESSSYSMDEVDHARRLAGKTRLNLATGRVTDETDPQATNDSYYFLSPQRRGEVIQKEEELVVEAGTITQAVVAEHANNATVVDILAAYIDGELTTPEFQKRYEAVMATTGTKHFTLNIDHDTPKEAKKLAFESGKWDRILTPQEILLRIGGRVDESYLVRPYTPLAVQDDQPLEEIANLRRGEQSMVVNATILQYEMPFGFRLEELDENGNTIKSPTFLDRNDGVETIEDQARSMYAGQINFPFARPEDWFYQKPEEA